MGHVPTGEVPATSARADLPGREYRRTGAGYPALTRREIGELGESIAASFLIRNGLKVVARNVRVGRGEIDILAEDRKVRVAVEVKSLVVDPAEPRDPVDAFDDAKASQVWSLARHVGARRVDVVGVGFGMDGVRIRWLSNV